MMHGAFVSGVAPGRSPLSTGSFSWEAFGIFTVLTVVSLVVAVILHRKERREALVASEGVVLRKKVASVRSTTFADVAGHEAVKQQLQDVVDFLKRPKRYQAYGATLPKGILLTGPPGVGKTLLAKAVAGEAGVPFFFATGSDFREKYVGVGASRIRQLFAQAKKAAPCLVFLDEFDSLARRRDQAHEETADTLNAFLTQMDGFSSSSAIVVLASTNFADALDPAAIRPGRFDRHIDVLPPDRLARKAIFAVHAQGKPMGPIDWDALSRKTAGLSGAHLASILNEAAILCALEDGQHIEEKHLHEALTRVLAGIKHEGDFSALRERIAVHEAGHAVLALALGVTPEYMTIEPRGRSLGHVFYAQPHEALRTKNQLEAEIQILLGGLLAENLRYGEHGTGAAHDLARATDIAKDMIGQFGMGDTLAVQKSPSQEAIEALLQSLFERAKALLGTHREAHRRLVDAVLCEGILSKDVLSSLFLYETSCKTDEIHVQ